MPLRTFLPAPYTLDVYPIEEIAANQQGNKSRRNAEQPVQRPAQSIHVFESGERINPAYIDRVVTRLRIMVPDASVWKDGDELDVLNMGRYRVITDPEPRGMGPFTQYNYLLGGRLDVERVN